MNLFDTDDAVRRQLASAVADLPVSPAPVDAVVRRGRIRKLRRTGITGSVAALVAVVPVAAFAITMTHGVGAAGAHPSAGVSIPAGAGGGNTAGTQPSGPTPAPPAPPLDAATQESLARTCAAEMQRTGRAVPYLSARTLNGAVVLVRVGADRLVCWQGGRGFGAGASTIGGGPDAKISVNGTSAAHPVREIDGGNGFDGRHWHAVFRVAKNITALTISVDGGPPQGAAVSDGWAVAAALSGKPQDRPHLTPAQVTSGNIPRFRDPTVQVTAFDAAGAVVWSGTGGSYDIGWVSPTHPSH